MSLSTFYLLLPVEVVSLSRCRGDYESLEVLWSQTHNISSGLVVPRLLQGGSHQAVERLVVLLASIEVRVERVVVEQTLQEWNPS